MQVGYEKNRCFDQYLTSSRAVNAAIAINTVPLDSGKLVTLVVGSNKRRSLLFTADGRRSVYDKKSQCYIKTTEQRLIVRSGKYEAEITVQ